MLLSTGPGFELDDIFEVQDGIAEAVVKALEVSLLAAQGSRSRGGHDQLLDAPDLLIDELAQRPRAVALLSSEMAKAARHGLQRSVSGRSAVTDRDRGSFLVFMFAFLQMIRHLTMLVHRCWCPSTAISPP